MTKPKYDLDKVKFATGSPVWERAVDLYERGKVTRFEDRGTSFAAVVLGGSPYEVLVSADRFDVGDCTCYLGQNDELCKHMVALAIRTVTGVRPLTDEEKKMVSSPISSGRKGMLSADHARRLRGEITATMRLVKPYNGPSRTWFAYQASLSEGANRLAAIVPELPVCEASAQLLVDMLLRLDKKLCTGGVDDSDGTIGGFMEETVAVLVEYAKLDPECSDAFRTLIGRETCFEWEQPLLAVLRTMSVSDRISADLGNA